MTNTSITYKPIPTTSQKSIDTFTTNINLPFVEVSVDGIGGKGVISNDPGFYLRKDDVASTTEQYTRVINKVILEIVNTIESISTTGANSSIILDMTNAFDTKVISITKNLSETSSVVESIAKSIDVEKLETIISSEIITFDYTVNISETTFCYDLIDGSAETQSYLGREDDTLILREDGFFIIRESNDLDQTIDMSTTSDILYFNPLKVYTDSTLNTETLIFSLSGNKSSDFSVTSDTVILNLDKTYTDTGTTSEVVTKLLDTIKTDSSIVTDSISISNSKSYNETSSTSESFSNTITKIIVESVITSDNDGFNNNFILREDGFFILREDNSNIYREDAF